MPRRKQVERPRTDILLQLCLDGSSWKYIKDPGDLPKYFVHKRGIFNFDPAEKVSQKESDQKSKHEATTGYALLQKKITERNLQPETFPALFSILAHFSILAIFTNYLSMDRNLLKVSFFFTRVALSLTVIVILSKEQWSSLS